MQIEIHTGVFRIRNKMMIFPRLTDHDIACSEVMRPTIDLQASLALQDNEDFMIVLVNVSTFPVARVALATNIMGPLPRFLEAESTGTEILAGYHAGKDVATTTGKILKKKAFHCAPVATAKLTPKTPISLFWFHHSFVLFLNAPATAIQAVLRHGAPLELAFAALRVRSPG